MAKNIVILSDGTGQGARMPKAERSNVWKLWDATKKAAPAQEVTFYDEGLGAEHKREWWRWVYDLASRATGLGISQNIKDCYTALIEYYEPGDRVFLFGFSRGAYTVRSLGGVLGLCGIPQRDEAGNSPRDRQNKKGRLALVEEAVEKIYKHYGDRDKEKERNALGADYRARYHSFSIDASNPPFPYFMLEAADVLKGGRIRGALQKRSKPRAAADVAPLRARRELARVHVLDHAMAQRGDRTCAHERLLSWMRSTTPPSSRQDTPPAIDDLCPPLPCSQTSRALSRSDLVLWHV
jgi:hypothetical protein